MSTPHWEDLRAEFRDVVIGPLWLAEVERATRRVAPKYPPASYTETGEWNALALENLVQEVTLTQLLDGGQLAYVLDTANDLSSARALLAHIVRRTLARTRQRTIIDNLLDRANELSTFPAAHEGAGADAARLYEAATAVSRLPRIRIINSDRAPAVFSSETLGEALRLVEQTLGRAAVRGELSRILELALTDYLPSRLVQIEGGVDESDYALTPEEQVTVADTLTRVMALPDEALSILALKIDDHSDTVVAHHLGVSRPTAAKRFREASAMVEAAIATLDTRLQDEILSRLAERLLADHLPELAPNGEAQ